MVFIIVASSIMFMGCEPVNSPPKVIKTYTITYNANGFLGGNIPQDNTLYQDGDVVILKSALLGTEGWSLLQTGSTVSTFTMPSSNVTVYAQWQKVNPSIIFSNTNDINVTTGVYQKNGIGVYYTMNSNIIVSTDAFFVKIGNENYFVNNMYFDKNIVFRTTGTIGTYDDVPQKCFYLQGIENNFYCWLAVDGSTLKWNKWSNNQPIEVLGYDGSFSSDTNPCAIGYTFGPKIPTTK